MNNAMQHDELSSVRRARERVGGVEPGDDDLVRGFARFERDLARSLSGDVESSTRVRARARRKRTTWAGIGVIAAGAIAGVTLVATPAPVFGPIAPADTSAQAAELLGRAADQALAADAELAPGQYLRVASRSEGIGSSWNVNDYVNEGEPAALVKSQMEVATYLPADHDAPYTVRQSADYGRQLVYPLGGDLERQVREEFAVVDDAVTGPSAEPAPGAENDDTWPRGVEAGRSQAPTDVDGLRAYVLGEARQRENGDSPISSEQRAIAYGAWSIVADQSLPGELRAAAYRLLATDSELEVTYFAGYDATQEWNSPADSTISIGAGTSVSIRVLPDVVTQLIFDDATGRLIGTRDVLERVSREYPGFVPGDVIGASEISTTVVEGIPDTENWD
ncbi:hypothetical protein [Leucobacter japonicus]|uniref:hypothetical protein n=1 Tax=Leucobacter japonicus TaxID=1461259 RepID=UPI0012E2AB86|nr:hypothetical protein [Leucobacter japonicus]